MDQSLWAKKQYRDIPPPTVVEHCRDVCRTAESLFHAIGPDLTAALELDAAAVASLLPLLKAGALLHDIAKINSVFQGMLRAKPGDTRRQPVRHEILAAWLLSDPDFFGHWFGNLRREDEVWPIVWAVAGHHLKMTDPRHAPVFNLGSEVSTVDIPLSLDEVRELLRNAASALCAVSDPPQIGDARFDIADDDDDGLEQRIHRFVEASCQAWRQLRRNPEVARRTALLKALLISADVAASALTADGKEPSEWTPNWLAVRIDSSQALQPVIEAGTNGKELLPFQEQVRDSRKSATIVIAGCGNGKTTAAYLWAQKHAMGKKLWFTYPTTGTASAGYRGYLYDHPDLRSALIHGRDEVDLQAMRGAVEDERVDDESVRIESLRAWGREVIACTVDTVLGLLQNQRRPLFSFPAIAAGAFVFDEIHSYDAGLFEALLRFLKVLPGAPVLLMSASISPVRLKALREVLGDRTDDAIEGDQLLEGYKRYRLESRATAETCRDQVAAALRDNKKVLWVCNTVTDAINEARGAHDWAGIAPEQIIVYHSRFRYGERVVRQNEVLGEFQYSTEKSPQRKRIKPLASLVIATQVCEMSLDISADLLVTAECPLPSLVQRLGRLNRYATADDPWPCLVYSFHGNPYNERPELTQTHGDYRVGMTAAREALRELDGKACGQQDLAQRLKSMDDSERFGTYSAWLDDGWLTEPVQLRDGDGSITLIRQEDLRDIEQQLGRENARPSKWTFKSLVPWTIPMRYRQGFRCERRTGGYPVAPAGDIAYCKTLGATWTTKTN